jgi:hypothetical protein
MGNYVNRSWSVVLKQKKHDTPKKINEKLRSYTTVDNLVSTLMKNINAIREDPKRNEMKYFSCRIFRGYTDTTGRL